MSSKYINRTFGLREDQLEKIKAIARKRNIRQNKLMRDIVDNLKA